MSTHHIQVEKPRHREAYRYYLGLGRKRTLAALLERLREEWGEEAPSAKALEDWSSSFDWQERVAADDEVISERGMALFREKQARDMERRTEHGLVVSDMMMNMVTKAITGEDDLLDLRQIPPAQARVILRMYEVARHAQRLDMGQASERVDAMSEERAIQTILYLPEELPEPDPGSPPPDPEEEVR